ncbi:MAG: methyltransferase domain-containing protein [Phycisphaeraceae bacterium]
MPTPRLYDDLAYLWPLLSPPEHYAAETATVRRVIDARMGPAAPGQRRTVLELGAGGGHTLHYLREDFDCVALDLSEPMLANCRALNPDVETVVGDMRTARLGRTFDAVLIHDAIDYMTTADDVRATLDTAAAHLAPGGVVLIAPTYTADAFPEHETEQDHRANDDVALTYFGYVHDPDPADTTFELILLYIIKQPPTGPATVVEDRHTCGLFSVQAWATMMHDAGFDVDWHEEPAWSLFVGVRQ